MVAVLLAALRVSSGCLKVPAPARRYPYVPPGWRDRELADALKCLVVLYPFAIRSEISKTCSRLFSSDAGLLIVHMDEPGAFCRLGRLDDGFVQRHRLTMMLLHRPSGTIASELSNCPNVICIGESVMTRKNVLNRTWHYC